MKNFSIAVCLSLLSAWTAHAQNVDLYASLNHPNVTGPGAVYKYTPAGVQATVLASVVQPRGLAFDSVGDLFVNTTNFDNTGNYVGSILEITPAGAVSTFATAFPTNFFLHGLAVDSTGNVFVMGDNFSDPNLAGTIFKVSPGGGVSTFGTIPGLGFGLAFDSTDNLFAADSSGTIYKFTPAGVRTVFVGPSAFPPTQGPVGLAFDSAGNLFASTEDSNGNGEILKFAPNGAETTFATGLTNNPRGLAFDSAGDLFVAEVSPPGVGPGDILKYPAGSNVPTVFAAPVGRPQGNGGPEYLAFPPLTPSFVIGDRNAVVGNHVTFWGAQWAKQNSLSGGSAPKSFKGFADSTRTNPPACGGTWTSDPGNSSGPPATIGPSITVIVASSITQSGSTIAGNTPELVIVQTDPGYAPNPGHPGTGTVTSVICH